MLLAGQLRFRDCAHFKRFLDSVAPFDVFVSTTPEYASVAARLAPAERRFVAPIEEQRKGNIYQWRHLDRLLALFADSLAAYEQLYRLRTDLTLPLPAILDIESRADTLYGKRDFLFGGDSAHFARVFRGFHSAIELEYYGLARDRQYFALNRTSIALMPSAPPPCMWQWFVLPKSMWDPLASPAPREVDASSATPHAGEWFYPAGRRAGWDALRRAVLSAQAPQGELRTYKSFDGDFSSEKWSCFHMLRHGAYLDFPPKVQIERDRVELVMDGRQEWPVLPETCVAEL